MRTVDLHLSGGDVLHSIGGIIHIMYRRMKVHRSLNNDIDPRG